MTNEMDCRRAEELLSDHLEGILEEPLLSELESHVRSCAGCRQLREALAEVVATLRAHPVLEPPAGLATRAAAAALARPQEAPPVALSSRALPTWLQAAAAALALAVSGLVLLAAGAAAPSHTTGRLKERAVQAGTYLVERKDRLVEDFRILRVVIGAAFGSRLDRVNDRVDDYRRLLERRRTQVEPKKSHGTEAGLPTDRRARGLRFPSNITTAGLVACADL